MICSLIFLCPLLFVSQADKYFPGNTIGQPKAYFVVPRIVARQEQECQSSIRWKLGRVKSVVIRPGHASLQGPLISRFRPFAHAQMNVSSGTTDTCASFFARAPRIDTDLGD